MLFHLTQSQRLQAVICISLSFFVAEIAVGFHTSSLALVADAFHYLNDLIGFCVAFAAIKVSSKKNSPRYLSFGWQRSRLLGAFFNGVFLLALGVSIFLQSIERFISLELVQQPKLVLIIGCIGLALNILSATFLHEHDHGGHSELPGQIENNSAETLALHSTHRHNNLQHQKSGYDLGLLGVLIHVMGDAANNVGVIISALVIWLTHYPARYYADPAVSMAIALVIFSTSVPLVKRSGKILLESAPHGIDLADIKHDLERIPGVQSIHELHVWRLNQKKTIASLHVTMSKQAVSDFVEIAKIMNDCLHSYGIHSVTVQPELAQPPASAAVEADSSSLEIRQPPQYCQIKCGSFCEVLTCCG